MPKSIKLQNAYTLELNPISPYNFDANFHKPSYFPSSDNHWEKEKYWITMYWQRRDLGLKFQNQGSIDDPKIKTTIYSRKPLTKDLIMKLTHYHYKNGQNKSILPSYNGITRAFGFYSYDKDYRKHFEERELYLDFKSSLQLK